VVEHVFHVDGLDCAEEVAALKREVGGRPGVLSLDLDVLNARMTVTHDPEQIRAEEIIEAVAATGMRAVPWKERAKPAPESFWQRHGRLMMAGASGVLLVAGVLAHWLVCGSLLHVLAAGDGGRQGAFPPVAILLYAGAMVSGAWFVIPKAVSAGKRLRPDMNLLMVVAIIGAVIIGEWFEAGTVAFLFAVALLMEHWSVGRARRAIGALMDLSPPVARYVNAKDGTVLEDRVEEVPVGATVLVRPGEKIPLDGVVTKGASTVNQAPITGESVPVAKEPGDEVFAGTLNEDGALDFRATKAASDTTLAHIIHLVQEAQSRRAPAEQWVERFARHYTPAMMALAATIVILPPWLLSASWMEWLYRGLVVLVIACPCALVISTPVTVVSGLTAAARHGVLVKGGVYLEAVGRLGAIAMDKTGTLTHGEPAVQEVAPLNGHTSGEVLERAAALEAHSEHPLARAILREAHARGLPVDRADDFQAVKGKGAEGRINGRLYWIGSHRFMEEMGAETEEVHRRAEELEDAGHSVVAVGNEDHVCGLISVADGVREDAPETVRALKELGLGRVVMLTGDNDGTAQAVALAVGIDDVRAELLPEDKVESVESLVRRFGHVAMVGDGVNDAPAMAVADVGVAMGAIGADAAIETADIALMSDDLSKLPWLVRHSRRTLGIIKQNIAFALGLKFAFIVLALIGVASLWMAIAADMGASLLVIFNGLRLLAPEDPDA